MRQTDLRLEGDVVVENALSLGHPELDVVGGAPGWPAPAAAVGAGGKGRRGGGGRLSRGGGGARSGRKGFFYSFKRVQESLRKIMQM